MTLHLVVFVQVLWRVLSFMIKFCNTVYGKKKKRGGWEGELVSLHVPFDLLEQQIARCSSLWDLAQSYQDAT